MRGRQTAPCGTARARARARAAVPDMPTAAVDRGGMRGQGVDRGRTAVGAVRFEHACHAPGRHQPAGGAGPQVAATAGEGDGHLPRARGALQPNVRRAHPAGDVVARAGAGGSVCVLLVAGACSAPGGWRCRPQGLVPPGCRGRMHASRPPLGAERGVGVSALRR
jgi:hypothetical protein